MRISSRKMLFQSTLSVRRATGVGRDAVRVLDISIHALRKESDGFSLIVDESHMVFQSTLSVRRATTESWQWVADELFQSTLSVRRATGSKRGQDGYHEFQSTLSVRRATITEDIMKRSVYISIHALRKESDPSCERMALIP